MSELLSLCLLYLACFAFIQAGARRTQFAGIKRSKRNQAILRVAGWATALVSLVVVAGLQGWERGIPVWLAEFVLAAFAALLLGALLPRAQSVSAATVAGLAVLAAVVIGLGGHR